MNSFKLVAIEGRGNGLIAARDIAAGEKIFTETPMFWHSRNKGRGDRELCNSCGRLISDGNVVRCNCGLGCGSAELVSASSSSSSSSSGGSRCNFLYCSSRCREADISVGHRWMCKNQSTLNLDALLNELDGLDSLGHFGLALVAYCKIAELYLNSRSSSTPSSLSAEEAAASLLSGFHSADYCRSLHAWRSGQIDVDESMFRDIIRPAYFTSHLERPFAIIKLILSDLGAWGASNPDISDRILVANGFINSSVLSEDFFSNLCGIFVSNNLQIKIKSDPSTVFKVDSHSTGADGTGLFDLFSKLNHSCNCNTVNANDVIASISVFACRSISAGEEITTSYLHFDPQKYSVKRRNKELVQYLFRCKCEVCQAQRLDAGLDTDDCSSEEDEDI